VQLRFRSELNSEEYVKQQGWLRATLSRCPVHARGGCGFRRHTAYERVEPPGTRIARYYCPKAHTTFSLLPDCLASRLSSTLSEVEQVADRVERRLETSGTMEAVAKEIRPDIGTQGALRWVRRRVSAVQKTLVICVGLLPSLLAGTARTLGGFRASLGTEAVLTELRERVAEDLRALPPPVGLGHRSARRSKAGIARQHRTGADRREPPS
jgi:hypothetical protein